MLTLPDFKEKKVLIIFPQDGDKISFSNDNLVVKDENNKTKIQQTCYKIFMLIIVGGFTITSGIIERAKRFNFSIVFMTHTFKVYETINSIMQGNTLLRKKQYTNMTENKIAKQIIVTKLKSQKSILEKIRTKNEDLKETISVLNENIIKLISFDYNDSEVMGIEGNSARIYFKEIFSICQWNGRQPRVKRDVTNFLLDMGYTLLFNYIEAITNVFGFDIYKGNLHKEFYKRKSLICDLIEPFRPIIDYKIRTMYNLNQIAVDDFVVTKGKYTLPWNKQTKYMLLFFEEIMSYKEIIFIFVQNYYRWFMKEEDITKFPTVELI